MPGACVRCIHDSKGGAERFTARRLSWRGHVSGGLLLCLRASKRRRCVRLPCAVPAGCRGYRQPPGLVQGGVMGLDAKRFCTNCLAIKA